MGYIELPKKGGKTEWVAGVILLALMLDKNPGCQVYGAAASQRQAGNVFRAACKMVEQAPVLRSRLRILRSTNRIIKKSDPESFYAAVAGDGDLSDGVNPAVFVADEVHRWRARKHIENWDVLSKGGITRRQTLTIGITTAGVQNESPLAWRMHEKTRRIREGVIEDAAFYGRIYGADPKDDWTDEATWIKANPSLIENGGFLPLAKIRAEYESTLSDPEGQVSFRRYFLNMWDQKEDRAVAVADWDACVGDWQSVGLRGKAPEDEVRPMAHDHLAHFIGRKCWAGVDLSMTTDLSAVTFVFPREDGGYDFLPFAWMPDLNIRKREVRDGMPFQEWARLGFLELCEGAYIDYREIRKRLIWGAQMFNLQEICWDPMNSREISASMSDEGYTCIEVIQGYNKLSEPSKKFLALIQAKKISHGGHPVLRWNVSCLSTKRRNDELMFDKPERSKNSTRIDTVAAAMNAISRAIVEEDNAMSYTGVRSVG